MDRHAEMGWEMEMCSGQVTATSLAAADMASCADQWGQIVHSCVHQNRVDTSKYFIIYIFAARMNIKNVSRRYGFIHATNHCCSCQLTERFAFQLKGEKRTTKRPIRQHLYKNEFFCIIPCCPIWSLVSLQAHAASVRCWFCKQFF